MAWSNNQSRVCEITIPAAQVGSGGVTNFTILLNEDCFPSEMLDADGASPCRTDGTDLEFGSDIDGTTLYDTDVINITLDNNPASSVILVAVEVGSLSSAVSNSVFVAYNGDAGTLAGSGAYASDWALYWPLEEGSGTSIGDRTENGNNASMTLMDSGDWTTGDGAYSSALDFDGLSNHRIEGGNSDEIEATNTFTFYQRVNKGTGGNGSPAYLNNGHINPVDLFGGGGDRTNLLLFINSSERVSKTAAISTGVWTDIAATYDGSDAKLFVEGASVASATIGSVTLNTTANGYAFGSKAGGTDRRNDVILASAVVWDVAKEAAWLTTFHNMEDAPGTFASAGTPGDIGGGGGISIPVVMHHRRMMAA